MVGNGIEVEHRPALAITVAVLPDVTLTPFRVADSSLPGLDVSPREWHHLMGVAPTDQPQFIVLADPYSIRIENLLMGMDYTPTPKRRKWGGLASGAARPGRERAVFEHRLLPVRRRRRRAVGQYRARHDGRAGMPADRQGDAHYKKRPKYSSGVGRAASADYFARSFYDLGRARSEPFAACAVSRFGDGSFEVSFYARRFFDPQHRRDGHGERAFLAVGALLRQGQIVQFHLRDAQTSTEDLEQTLSMYAARSGREQLSGALLFSCLGRGEYLYGQGSHDTRLFQEKLGRIPVSGFFCNGEIGPVGGTTYLHGYTKLLRVVPPCCM